MTTPKDIIVHHVKQLWDVPPCGQDAVFADDLIKDLVANGFVIVPREPTESMSDMGDDMAEAGAPISHIWEAMIDVALEEQAK